MQLGVYEATMESIALPLGSQSALPQHTIQWHATAEQQYPNLVPANAFGTIASESQLQFAAIHPQHAVSNFDQLVGTVPLITPPSQQHSTALAVAPLGLNMHPTISHQTYASPLALLAHVALPPSPEASTSDNTPSSMMRQASLVNRESFVRNSQPRANLTSSPTLPLGVVSTTAPLSATTASTPPAVIKLEPFPSAVSDTADSTPSPVASHAVATRSKPPIVKLDKELGPRSLDDTSAPTKIRVHVCNDCPRSFNSGQGLRMHVRIMHSPVTRAYQCPLPNCHRIQVSLSNAQRHLVGHGPAFRNLPLRPVDIPTHQADQYLSKRATKRTPRATSSTSSATSSSSTRPVPSSSVPLTLPTANSNVSLAQHPPQEHFLPPPASLREPDCRAVTRSGLYPMLAPPENGYSTLVPLPPVTPSGTFARYAVPLRTPTVDANFGSMLHEGVVEERDSFADAPEWPYHPSGWNVRPLLPGPAPLPGTFPTWIPPTTMREVVRTVANGSAIALATS